MSSTRTVTIYSALIISLGLFVLVGGVVNVLTFNNVFLVCFYIMISFITESLNIDIGNNTYISLGFAISIACVFIFPPFLAGFIIFLGVFFRFEMENGKLLHIFNTSILKRLFNCSAYSLIVFCSDSLYRLQIPFGQMLGQFMGISIINGIVAMASYVVLCILIYSILFSFLLEKPLLSMVYEYKWIASKFIAMAPIGLLIATTQQYYGWFSIFLFMGPLLLARYSFVQYLQMKEHYMRTINSFTKALDAKDRYTNGHSERVSEYAVGLAKRMNLEDKRIEELKVAALLHDVGKIGVSDMILNKPDRLSLQEMYEIKRHPEIGANIIEEISFLKHTSQIIRHHHERYDGAGYPDGISMDAIPLEARMIAIVDAYDAMTSDRPYRKALTKEQSLRIIDSEKGRQFDPEMVSAFIAMMEEMDQYAG